MCADSGSGSGKCSLLKVPRLTYGLDSRSGILTGFKERADFDMAWRCVFSFVKAMPCLDVDPKSKSRKPEEDMNLMRVMVLGVFLSSGLAAAGVKVDHGVIIDLRNRSAYASMGGARNSSDSTQYLACEISANTGGVTGFCEAQDAQGLRRTCYTTNQHLLEVIKSISDTSLVAFLWNEIGECTQVNVSHASVYGPRL